ncbi:MAG: type II toxin-antitoxin system VapC family toxin [Candidatus Dormibacteria bacterium]
MILADTSAWVEYDRATGSPADLRIAKLLADGGELAATEPVIMEVLAGARAEKEESDLRRLLLRCNLLSFDAPGDFDSALRIYRRCRSGGVTPRGMVDCMIAAVAWRRGATLLAHDADLERVARVVGLELDAGSLQGPVTEVAGAGARGRAGEPTDYI